jgi:hypothetical protein
MAIRAGTGDGPSTQHVDVAAASDVTRRFGEGRLRGGCLTGRLAVRKRRERMNRLFAALAGVLAACALVHTTAVADPTVASGGGRGTVDGTQAFSQFGFSVTRLADSSVQGSFNCLMAGASQFPGFTLMAVRGEVTSAAITASGASFSGAGMFQTGNQGKAPATFRVEVTAGGPGVGTLQLTLLTPFVFVLPTEEVLNGQISIH